MKELNLLSSYTNNYRLIYQSTISSSMEIKIEGAAEVIIKLPLTVPEEIFKKYRAGGAIYILGNEIAESITVATMESDTVNDFYNAQGLSPILTREYQGSFYNGGYHQIKSVDIAKRELTLETSESEIVPEEWNGAICITAWNPKSADIKEVKEYLDSQFGKTGMLSEKVKNYSYQISDSKNRIQKGTGLPIDLLLPFRAYKKMPNIKEQQIKKMIYGI